MRSRLLLEDNLLTLSIKDILTCSLFNLTTVLTTFGQRPTNASQLTRRPTNAFILTSKEDDLLTIQCHNQNTLFPDLTNFRRTSPCRRATEIMVFKENYQQPVKNKLMSFAQSRRILKWLIATGLAISK